MSMEEKEKNGKLELATRESFKHLNALLFVMSGPLAKQPEELQRLRHENFDLYVALFSQVRRAEANFKRLLQAF